MQVRKQVRIGHGTIDWFQIVKGVRQGCILSLCLFNLYAEYIMRNENAGLDEAQTGIKIAGRNINNLRYAGDTTLFFFFSESFTSLPHIIFFFNSSIHTLFFFFSFMFIIWRLITLQYCSGFCHTLT